MDRRPTLETRPPVLIDAVVRALIPPACREHVLGDLWERYRSPWQFVLDAAGTIPFVVASQIRRTSTLAGVVIHAFILFVSLGASSKRPVAAVAALGGAMLGFVLRDAYKRGISISVKQVAVDLGFGASGLIASQAIVALAQPGQLLTPSSYTVCAVAFGVIFLLRLQNPNLGGISRQAMTHVPATLEALMTEVRLFERMTRRGVRIEAYTGVAIAAFFVMPLVSSPNWALRIGWALASAYGLYVAVIVWKSQTPPMPESLEFGAALCTLSRRARTTSTDYSDIVALVPHAHGAGHASHHGGCHDRGIKTGQTTVAGAHLHCTHGRHGCRDPFEQSGLGAKAADPD